MASNDFEKVVHFTWTDNQEVPLSLLLRSIILTSLTSAKPQKQISLFIVLVRNITNEIAICAFRFSLQRADLTFDFFYALFLSAAFGFHRRRIERSRQQFKRSEASYLHMNLPSALKPQANRESWSEVAFCLNPHMNLFMVIAAFDSVVCAIDRLECKPRVPRRLFAVVMKWSDETKRK